MLTGPLFTERNAFPGLASWLNRINKNINLQCSNESPDYDEE